ncbi:MAG: DUF6279 family lipoprotein [Gammaproteobacteria bacterium]|nr:DUF6279 family lipoprotein [Gammaproteobacteria bacterium]
MPMLQRRPLLIISFILLLGACSLKTVYNRLDYLIPSYVEGLVSLDDVLEEKLKQRTISLVSWHRNTQLTQYAELLRTFQNDIQSPLNEELVLQHIVKIQLLWQSLEVKLNKEMAELLPLLNAEQQEELFASIEDKNEDYYDEYVDLYNDERIDQYTETTLETYENWLGYISYEQQRVIEKAAAELNNSAALRLDQRRLWQRSIQEILKTSESEEIKSKQLEQFFKRFSINDQPQLKLISDLNKKIIARLTVEIINQASPKQKTFFKNKTDEYIKIFSELAENR